MRNHLDDTLLAIGRDYENQIKQSSRYYVEVDIGSRAGRLGYSEVERKFRNVLAVVPLKRAVNGMKVRIDGRTFKKYGQIEQGVAVPERVVRHSNLNFKTYSARDSMILNFA